MRSVVVGFDGNVGAGKTSLVRVCAHGRADAVRVVDEHSRFLRDGSPATVEATQRRYLAAELDRGRHVLMDPAPVRPYVLLDRSFLSLAAHLHWLLAHGSLEVRAVARALVGHLRRSELAVPDLFVHVTCDQGERRRRLARREGSPEREGTSADLQAAEYGRAIDAFLVRWSRLLPDRCVEIDSTAGDLPSLAAEVIRTADVSRAQVPVEPCRFAAALEEVVAC